MLVWKPYPYGWIDERRAHCKLPRALRSASAQTMMAVGGGTTYHTRKVGRQKDSRRLSPPKFFWIANSQPSEASRANKPTASRGRHSSPVSRAPTATLTMPHQNPDGPMAKRQKVSRAVGPAKSPTNSSRIFAPFRVCQISGP